MTPPGPPAAPVEDEGGADSTAPSETASRTVSHRRQVGVAALTVASATFLAAALPGAIDGGVPLGTLLVLPTWLLFILFCVGERAIIPLYVQRGSRSQYSFSLSELPLVLGLLFAGPVALLATRVVAGVLVLIAEGHRELNKLSWNAVLFGLEVVTAIHVYRLVLGDRDPLSPAGWFAVFAAMAAVTLLGALMVPTVMFVAEGIRMFGRIPRMTGIATIIGAVNTSLGLVAVVALAADRRAGFLLLAVLGLLIVAFNGYSALSTKHESLVLLHRFTQRAGRLLEDDETIETLLREAATLLRVGYAEIAVREGSQYHLTIVRVDGDDVQVSSSVTREAPLHASVMADDAPLLIPRGPRSAQLRRQLRADLSDAVIVPLRAKDGVMGTLCLGGRYGILTPLTEDDLRLCQTVANHASVLLENGRLVDRLREEVVSKAHQASHDALTGLPNRSRFHERVQAAVLAARGANGLVAVMLLDLDRFKEVNDTLGHHVGDELLQEVGARLRATVKSTDTVARLGGDEFAIVLPSVRSMDEAVAVAERARAALEEPFEIGSLTLVVGASLGISFAPEHGDMATTLLQRADVAMYAAKGAHAGVVVYTSAVDTHSPRRLALVSELRKAIDADELMVHFQPKADGRTGEVVGAEALVRWLHPTEGPVSPEEFIPIAERTGMIHELTARVLTRALAQCARWRRAGHRIDVAVNVSAGSLMNLDFPEEVRRLLRQASVAPKSLTLEITESSIMADPTRSLKVLSALSAMGVQLAIDDFGTGYSSLSQLKQMPVDELKIDRSFIMDMTSDDDDATIVRSTIDLGHNLGLRLVAEGVEDKETWRRLRALGCDIVQGYYLSRPLEPASFERWLSEWDSGIEQQILPPADERARSVTGGDALERLRLAGVDVESLGFDGIA